MSGPLGDEFQAFLDEQLRDPGFRFLWYVTAPWYWLVKMHYRLRALLRRGE